MAREQLPTRSDTDKYRKARRKRQRARQMRRLEAVLPTRLALPSIARPKLPEGIISTQGARDSLRHVAGSGWHWSKFISGLLLIGALAGITWLHWDARWFVSDESIAFRDLGYLERADLDPSVAELTDWSIFWLKPAEIRQAIVDHPYVADAAVEIRLPNQVEISITEAEPTALWVTQEGTLWLLENGAALAMRIKPGMTPESAMVDATGRTLPQIIDITRDAQAPGRSAIDVDVLNSALALLETFPNLREIRYNSGAGLNFALPDGKTYVYWGDGLDTQTKLENLAAGQALLRSGEAVGNVIDVRYVDRPFIR
jgi:hypothetical protein